jgi:hypothetical protein
MIAATAAWWRRFSMAGMVIVVGLAVLLCGRQLFWLFVGSAGFVAGLTIARMVLADRGAGVTLVVALAAGLLGILLVILLERLAVSAAGFVAGGHLLVGTLAGAGLARGADWLAYLVGGMVGALLVVRFFDWALIALSVLLGTALLESVLVVGTGSRVLLFVALVAVGLVVQGRRLRRASVAHRP